ncbi:MAG TPA: FG-GAP-like repeat-containing protein, partial [Verrucomicrobiota bacterium]|nr:FG-GAP-like repeat-containing protein [Verrucomicrobiota bacterium]
MNSAKLIGIVSVLVASHWALAQEPQITTQPTNATASLGATVRFTVGWKVGAAPLDYRRWWFKDAPLDTDANPSAAWATLTLTNVTVAQSGPYFAVVVDTAGLSATSQVATLTVDPTFTKVMSGPPVDDPPGGSDFDWGYCATWGDYDGDGDVDLAVVGGLLHAYTPLLYTNQSNATLSRVTAPPWTTPRNFFTANWADYDNDGDLDLWAGSIETSYPVLYTNQGAGRFTAINVSPTWIENQVDVRGDVQAWADYDGDGHLDLVVANHVYSSTSMTLLHNSANGKFTAVTDSPLAAISDFWTSLDWVDYDGDGDLDLIASRSWSGPMLFLRGEGGFLNPQPAWELSAAVGYGEGLFTRGAFAWGDYDNDGDLDPYATRGPGLLCRNEGHGQYVALGDTQVKPLAIDWPLTSAWGDWDNDGYLDLFVIRGPYAYPDRRNALFHNDGQGGFEEVLSGSPVGEWANSSSCAWADYDNDGDLDLFVANAVGTGASGKDFFYVNNGNDNSWLEVKLVGAAPQPATSNRDGIGANVRVKATIGGKTFWQLRAIASSTWHTELVAHFGLGDAANAEALRIEWPSGLVQEFANLPAKQILQVRESVLVPTANAELVGPATYDVVEGAAVTLQAPTQGPGETYQWQFNGRDIAGATGPAFEITSFQVAQLGSYCVVMTGLSDPTLGAFEARCRPVRLEMKERPLIAGPVLWAATVNRGARVEMSVWVTGTDSFVCQWQRNGIDIASAENPSATNLTLVLDAAVQADAGDYRIVVNHAAHRVTSEAVHLTVDPTFTKITTGPVVEDYQASSSGTWWDYDHDGFLDLLVAQASMGPATNVLYRGHGDGTFDKVSDSIIVKTPGWCNSGTVGDFNNDGLIDLFVVNSTGVDSLFRNEGEGRFTRLTSAQCGPPVSDGSSYDATWVDYDCDGFLDLFTVNYDYPVSRCLYRNRGDGFFVKMTGTQVG